MTFTLNPDQRHALAAQIEYLLQPSRDNFDRIVGVATALLETGLDPLGATCVLMARLKTEIAGAGLTSLAATMACGPIQEVRNNTWAIDEDEFTFGDLALVDVYDVCCNKAREEIENSSDPVTVIGAVICYLISIPLHHLQQWDANAGGDGSFNHDAAWLLAYSAVRVAAGQRYAASGGRQ